MVQSINGPSRPGGPSRSSGDSLRTNFRSLSSGKAAPSGDAAEVRALRPDSSNIDQVIQGLSDAVSFSAKALKSLEGLGDEVKQTEKNRAAEFGKDLEALRKTIGSTIESLQSGIATAEVIRENVTSSESKIEDLDAAHEQVASMLTEIEDNSKEALAAHKPLLADRVAALLSEG